MKNFENLFTEKARLDQMFNTRVTDMEAHRPKGGDAMPLISEDEELGLIAEELKDIFSETLHPHIDRLVENYKNHRENV